MDQVWGETLSISGIRWIQRNLSSEGGQKPMNRWNVPFNMPTLILINDHHYHHPHNHFWLMGYNCPRGVKRGNRSFLYTIPHYISRYLQNVKQSEAPSKITHSPTLAQKAAIQLNDVFHLCLWWIATLPLPILFHHHRLLTISNIYFMCKYFTTNICSPFQLEQSRVYSTTLKYVLSAVQTIIKGQRRRQ